MTGQNIEQEVQDAWNMSEEDLYKHLGMVSLGTNSLSESTRSMNMLMSMAANPDAEIATNTLWENLLENGRNYFARAWNALKDIICTIYKGNDKLEGKDLVSYIVGELLGMIGGAIAAGTLLAGIISNPLLILVITIAVKKGLDLLCAIPK